MMKKSSKRQFKKRSPGSPSRLKTLWREGGWTQEFVEELKVFVAYVARRHNLIFNEDSFQKVLLKMIEALPDFQPDKGKFESYIYTLARNQLTLYTRVERRIRGFETNEICVEKKSVEKGVFNNPDNQANGRAVVLALSWFLKGAEDNISNSIRRLIEVVGEAAVVALFSKLEGEVIVIPTRSMVLKAILIGKLKTLSDSDGGKSLVETLRTYRPELEAQFGKGLVGRVERELVREFQKPLRPFPLLKGFRLN